jgi:hypothetical protein
MIFRARPAVRRSPSEAAAARRAGAGTPRMRSPFRPIPALTAGQLWYGCGNARTGPALSGPSHIGLVVGDSMYLPRHDLDQSGEGVKSGDVLYDG